MDQERSVSVEKAQKKLKGLLAIGACIIGVLLAAQFLLGVKFTWVYEIYVVRGAFWIGDWASLGLIVFELGFRVIAIIYLFIGAVRAIGKNKEDQEKNITTVFNLTSIAFVYPLGCVLPAEAYNATWVSLFRILLFVVGGIIFFVKGYYDRKYGREYPASGERMLKGFLDDIVRFFIILLFTLFTLRVCAVEGLEKGVTPLFTVAGLGSGSVTVASFFNFIQGIFPLVVIVVGYELSFAQWRRSYCTNKKSVIAVFVMLGLSLAAMFFQGSMLAPFDAKFSFWFATAKECLIPIVCLTIACILTCQMSAQEKIYFDALLLRAKKKEDAVSLKK